VLVETPGGTYWRAWERFLADEVGARGLVWEEDRALYRITDDVAAAAAEILGFYRNYHSIRYVGDRLVIRLRARPTDDEISLLNDRFADLCLRGGIVLTEPLPAEVAGADCLELPRLVLWYARGHHRRLRALVDAVNRLPSAASQPPSG
jgi:hypothetical protein